MSVRGGYIPAMIRLNLRIVAERPRRTLGMAAAMYVQDLLLFAGWIVFFGTVGRVRGWGLPEIFLLYGMQYASYGCSNCLTDGIRTLGPRIADGQLDIFLTRPRNPLPALIFARVNPANLGDFCAGLTLLAGAGLDATGFLLAVACAAVMGVLFDSAKLIYHSLAFHMEGGYRTAEYLTDSLYYMAIVPQEGHGPLVRAILFSVIPAGFLVLVPVHLIRAFSVSGFALLAAAAFAYFLLALWVFDRGLKRYMRGG